ncbi:MAG: ankyrin repeat domain-containing protein [Candidatus Anstonellales archaeon]
MEVKDKEKKKFDSKGGKKEAGGEGMKEERRLSDKEVFRRVLESVRSRREDNEAFDGLKRINKDRREEIGEERSNMIGKELIEECKKDEVVSVERVVKLILEGANLDLQDDKGWTAFRHAGWNGHKNIVKVLLPLLDKIDMEDLLWFARTKNFEIVEMFIKAGADVNFASYGETALYWAAYEGHPETIKVLLRAGAKVNVGSEKNGFTPLMNAAFMKNVEAVEILIEAGADPFIVDEYGRTAYYIVKKEKERRDPLGGKYEEEKNYKCKKIMEMLAVYEEKKLKEIMERYQEGNDLGIEMEKIFVYAAGAGKKEIVDELIKRGININSTYNSVSALVRAALNNDEEMVKFLVEKGIDLNLKTKGGLPAFLCSEKAEIVTYLIKAGSNKDILVYSEELENYVSPLLWAVSWGKKEIVKGLIRANVDLDPLALIEVSAYGLYEISKELIKAGADVDVQSPITLSTPMIMAAGNSHYDILELLMEAEADPFIVDKYGMTAYDALKYAPTSVKDKMKEYENKYFLKINEIIERKDRNIDEKMLIKATSYLLRRCDKRVTNLINHLIT